MNYWVYEDDQTDRVLVFPTTDGTDPSALNKKLGGTPWKPVALTPEDAGFACVLLKISQAPERVKAH